MQVSKESRSPRYLDYWQTWGMSLPRVTNLKRSDLNIFKVQTLQYYMHFLVKRLLSSFTLAVL